MKFDEFQREPDLVWAIREASERIQRPVIPLTNPDLPLAGPNFRRAAQALLGEQELLPLEGKGKQARMRQECLELTYLVWSALYTTNFSIPVLCKKQSSVVTYLPGGTMLEADPAGPTPSRVMVISKHPSVDDIARCAVFASKYAAPFHQALHELHATEASLEWYVTHLVRHPNPDPSGGAISAEWIADGALLLQQELMLVQPEVVICLGSESLKAVLGPGHTVSNMVGRTVEKTIRVPGGYGDLRDHSLYVPHRLKVVSVPNPSSVAHKPEAFPEFLESVRHALQVIDNKHVSNYATGLSHYAITNISQLTRAVDQILAKDPSPVVAWDAEWEGRNWGDAGAFLCTVQFSPSPGTSYLLDLVDANGCWRFGGSPQEITTELERLRDAPGSRHGGHFVKADIPWMQTFLGFDLSRAWEPPHEPLEVAVTDPATGVVTKTTLQPWERTKTEGGFDTGYMVHAVYESADTYKLEPLGHRFCQVPVYNGRVESWKAGYIRHRNIKAKDLEGYGKMPREVLFPYANLDADVTRRLFDVFNTGQDGRVGLLDCDYYGLSSRRAFWTLQQAGAGFLEIEQTGIGADPARAAELVETFTRARDDLLASVQEQLGWSDFNPKSTQHVTEILFGEEFHGKKDKLTGEPVRLRPELTPSFRLQPVKSSGKTSKAWDQIVNEGKEASYRPAVDKETLGILMYSAPDPTARRIVQMIRDVKFIGHVLTTVLRPGQVVDGQDDEETDFEVPPVVASEAAPSSDDGETSLVYDGGFMYYRNDDGRVRSRFYTAKTGRATSSSPNLQNFAKRREGDYERILGTWDKSDKTAELLEQQHLLELLGKPRSARAVRSLIERSDGFVVAEREGPAGSILNSVWLSADQKRVGRGAYCDILGAPRYEYPIRSMVREDDGHLLIEFDIVTAEVAVLAWLSNDAAMLEDVRRSMLKEGHPDAIDIHAKTAVEAFRLDCAPTKKGLESIGKLSIRVAAKNVRFGVPYGRTAPAIARQCLEEGTVVSVEDCQGLVDGYHAMYRNASIYLSQCYDRPVDPGYMINPYGRCRRFPASDDRKIVSGFGREAMNFNIQSTVADWVMLMMWKLIEYRRKHGRPGTRDFRLALQIHDALALRVPFDSVDWVWNEVLPNCAQQLPIIPHTLDGVPIPGLGPYYFGLDTEAFKHWGVKLKKADLAAMGIQLSAKS
jgi:uracil-DNA glycosylase